MLYASQLLNFGSFQPINTDMPENHIMSPALALRSPTLQDHKGLANSRSEDLGLSSHSLRRATKAVTLAFGRDTKFWSKSYSRPRQCSEDLAEKHAWRSGESQMVDQSKERTEVLFRKEFGGKPKNINIGVSCILTTI